MTYAATYPEALAIATSLEFKNPGYEARVLLSYGPGYVVELTKCPSYCPSREGGDHDHTPALTESELRALDGNR